MAKRDSGLTKTKIAKLIKEGRGSGRAQLIFLGYQFVIFHRKEGRIESSGTSLGTLIIFFQVLSWLYFYPSTRLLEQLKFVRSFHKGITPS